MAENIIHEIYVILTLIIIAGSLAVIVSFHYRETFFLPKIDLMLTVVNEMFCCWVMQHICYLAAFMALLNGVLWRVAFWCLIGLLWLRTAREKRKYYEQINRNENY